MKVGKPLSKLEMLSTYLLICHLVKTIIFTLKVSM